MSAVRPVTHHFAQRLHVDSGMQRSALSRVVTAMWGLWLAVALSVPMALHTCPAHGDRAIQMAAMAGMQGMADVSGGTANDDAAHHTTPGQSSHSGCTCIGDCCCAPTVMTPSPAVAHVQVAADVEYADAQPSCDVDIRVAAPSFAHPFANGPPAAPLSI